MMYFIDYIDPSQSRWREDPAHRNGLKINSDIYDIPTSNITRSKKWIQIYTLSPGELHEFFDKIDINRAYKSCLWINEKDYALFLLRFA